MSLVIEIRDPLENSHEKFLKALYTLSKATKVPFTLESGSHAEPTPYDALRELADSISDDVQDNLIKMFQAIVKKWLHLSVSKAATDSSIFRLDGKTFINPKSGKALTVGEWKKIQGDLTRMFQYIYGKNQEAMVKQAIAMGKVLQQLDPADRINAKISDLGLDLHTEAVSQDDVFSNILNWGGVHTGELIQDVTTRSRRAIVSTIMQGYQDGITARQLRERLFDQFSSLNRDWRRIAETETATNFNNGYLLSEVKQAPKDETIFMIGISGAGACSFCAQHVNEHVVVLLENPPAGGEEVTIEGKTYTAIWPGKNNFGRKRAEWWVASGSQHPHCRCTWTRYYPQMEEYMRKLKAATGS